MLISARYLVNSFHVTVRAPPEIPCMICSNLPTEDGVFSTSRVCRHWRSALILSPSLWTQFSCYHDLRTTVGLERCKSMPIQLKYDTQSSTVAPENVLLRGNKVTSLTVHRGVDQMPLLHQLFIHSGPSVERLDMQFKNWGVRGSR